MKKEGFTPSVSAGHEPRDRRESEHTYTEQDRRGSKEDQCKQVHVYA